jgi:hypothetical protein
VLVLARLGADLGGVGVAWVPEDVQGLLPGVLGSRRSAAAAGVS